MSLFDFSSSSTNKKGCELCGKISDNYLYRFIAEQMNTIFLNNPRIRFVDKEQRVVVLNDGSRLDYSWQVDANHAINFMDLTIHIFCSEKCEDNYIAKYPVFLRQNIADDILVADWRKQNQFVPQVFQTEVFCPKDMWSKCVECSTDYPSTKAYSYIKKENVSKIIKTDIISGKFGSKPHQTDDFDFTVGDMHKNNPEGYYYLYKSNLKSSVEKLFCSKECSYNYCVNNNSIAVSKNNLEKGSLTVITPHTTKINEKLGNNFIHRPHILAYV
jgi:hypothetical protein